ncbi:MAG: hypothetical protein VZR02_05935 [Lachnospiraceae bacterium]|nr:hypothetical protein [Lachnospiraceae bacterium]
MTGDSRYEEIMNLPEKGKVKTMCDVAERLENEGMAKGAASNMLALIDRFSRKHNVSVEEACNELDVTAEEYNAARKLIAEENN